jgi:hypothetical protein
MLSPPDEAAEDPGEADCRGYIVERIMHGQDESIALK